LFIFGTEADTFGPEGVTYDDHPLLRDSGRFDTPPDPPPGEERRAARSAASGPSWRSRSRTPPASWSRESLCLLKIPSAADILALWRIGPLRNGLQGEVVARAWLPGPWRHGWPDLPMRLPTVDRP
jgi:hypothetical protein